MLIIGLNPAADSVTAARPRPAFSGHTVPAAIQQRGYMRVGLMPDLPDYSLRDPRTGLFKGLEPELARAIARAVLETANLIDDSIQIVPILAREFEEMLVNGEIDAAIANLADTPERRKRLDFAGHYMATSHGPLVVEESIARKFEDLNDLQIAVGDGSTDIDTLLKVAPRAHLIPCDDARQCIEAVVTGQAHVYWTCHANAAGFIRASGGVLKSSPLTFNSNERWAVAIRKGEDEFGSLIGDVVNEVFESGRVNAWLKRLFFSK